MASTFPSIIATLADPNATDRLNSPSHSGLHVSENDEIEQTQRFLGTTSSAVGTIMYDVRAAASNGGGHVQTAIKGGTGQTTFTKGDLLVASSSSVLTKLAVGSNNAVLQANSAAATGVQWSTPSPSTLGFSAPSVLTYTASSVGGWIKPSLLSYIIVEVQGGGAGGGGVAATSNNGGAGGGGGGYAKKIIRASMLGLSENITIGAAGAGGIGQSTSPTSGGATVFGASSIVAASGGVAPSANDSAEGGLGGTGTGGDVNIPGGQGDSSQTLATTRSGRGGDSAFGRGGGGRETTGTGFDGTGFGGGGAGGHSAAGAGVATGGAGTAGVVYITNYFA